MVTSLAEKPPAAGSGRHAPAPSAPKRREGVFRAVDRIPVWLWIVAIVIALYFALPTLIVIPMSFNDGTTFKFPPENWSLRWYQNFFTDKRWLTSLGNSLLVAVLVMVVATAFGTAAAIALSRVKGSLASFVRTLLMVPLIAPAIVVAVAVYISFLQWRLTGTVLGYVLAHTALALPFVLVAVNASLGGFDTRLLRAAASLGASPYRAFVTVLLPLIRPGIVSGAVFAFVTSFDEVVVALFIRSPKFQTLPVQMYNSVTLEIDPTISAASSLIVVVVTVVILVPQLVRAGKKKEGNP